MFSPLVLRQYVFAGSCSHGKCLVHISTLGSYSYVLAHVVTANVLSIFPTLIHAGAVS